MATTIESQQAYVLHMRDYRNASLIVEFFTSEYGRVSAVARAAKNIRTQMKKSMIQPFIPLTIHCRGKGELLNLINIESHQSLLLTGSAIFCGLYINELLLRLTAKQDPDPELFAHYHQLLLDLSNHHQPDSFLRAFEIKLLSALGYQLTLTRTKLNQPVLADHYYRYTFAEGLAVLAREIHDNNHELADDVYFGQQLIAIAHAQWNEPNVLKDAKRLTRMAISALLGDKPLNSRKIYQAMMHSQYKDDHGRLTE